MEKKQKEQWLDQENLDSIPLKIFQNQSPHERDIINRLDFELQFNQELFLSFWLADSAESESFFLKQLTSGLLLITGPYKINGVPLRRVNQAYVLATSTKLDISSLPINEKLTDDYFKRPKAPKKQKTEEGFFDQTAEKKTLGPRAADQKAFDGPLLELIKKTPHLTEYLGAKFSLKRGQYPHELKF